MGTIFRRSHPWLCFLACRPAGSPFFAAGGFSGGDVLAMPGSGSFRITQLVAFAEVDSNRGRGRRLFNLQAVGVLAA